MTEDYRLVALLKKVKDIKQYEFSGRTVKYVATAVGVFLLLSHKRFRLFSKNINSLHALYGFMSVCFLLVAYQVTLLYLVAN